MFLFKKNSRKTFTEIESGIRIDRARYYSFVDPQLQAGSFYFSLEQSVGFFLDSRILIQARPNKNYDHFYELRNLNNGGHLGELGISKTLAPSLRAYIDIIHQEPYKWKLKSFYSSSLFKRRRIDFSGALVNGHEEAAVSWEFKEKLYFNEAVSDLPREGEISMTNPGNHLLLFVLLFMVEMEFHWREAMD
ncbi:hypothetical protein LZZ85_20720 [Terrimonas sp. NA20]|uniref:Uncharacterized protein n=1 Tax=Terrimonas ginsenosidimutans TaxID=2908004 RepID=A0ABS9KWQ3_9BACT|nr:hypothetical protein [Terrimonas ginsenosidimutans]MCG2616735.1 hypothetical protein [Terrimonas ginsenosidimutans]